MAYFLNYICVCVCGLNCIMECVGVAFSSIIKWFKYISIKKSMINKKFINSYQNDVT